MSHAVTLAALAALVLYVWRLDHLTWRRDRWRWLGTACGAGLAAWAVYLAGQSIALPAAAGLVMMSAAWLILPASRPAVGRSFGAPRPPTWERRPAPDGWLDEGTRFLSRSHDPLTRPVTTIATGWRDER